MDLIREQFPIVIHSLNIGFLQTLKLFFVTLIGALPLGLVISFGTTSRFKPVRAVINTIVLALPWYATDDPAADHLLFPGSCTSQSCMGRWRDRTFYSCSCLIHSELRMLFCSHLPRRHPERSKRTGRSRSCTGNDKTTDLLPHQINADDQKYRSSNVQRDHYTGKRYFSGTYHRPSGDHLGRSVFYERISRYFRRDLAIILYRSLLSHLERCAYRFTGQTGKETGLFQIRTGGNIYANLRSRTYQQILW